MTRMLQRLVAMATGAFAVPTLESLVQRNDLQLVALISRPARQRGSRDPVSPAVAFANAAGIDVIAPATVNSAAFHRQVEPWQPDLFFVCDYGEILSAATIGLAPFGGINLHGSLLPEYRGAAPVAWAILEGRTQTGVSVIHMTPRLDAGPVLSQLALDIDPAEDASSLERRLARLGVTAVGNAIDILRGWDGQSAVGVPQDASRSTHARRLRREDGIIDWNRPAKQLVNQVRGLQPWPGTFTHCQTESGTPLRLQILTAHELEYLDQPVAAAPGTILSHPEGQFAVATSDGALVIEFLRPENRKVISGADFLRGYRLRPGARLASYGR